MLAMTINNTSLQNNILKMLKKDDGSFWWSKPLYHKKEDYKMLNGYVFLKYFF